MANLNNLKGFLHQYESKGFTPSLCRRWGVLNDGQLYLYNSPEDPDFAFAIILPGCKINAVSTDDRERRYFIEVIDLKGETAYITPEDPNSFNLWYQVLLKKSQQTPLGPARSFDRPDSSLKQSTKPAFGNLVVDSVLKDSLPPSNSRQFQPPREVNIQSFNSKPVTRLVVNNRPAMGLETVREDPNMPDQQVFPTVRLEDMRKKYPVSGLAKRMSIAASDLLGKSHDELVLLLIQLNREEANFKEWKNYYNYQMAQIQQQLSSPRLTRDQTDQLRQNIFQIELELNDINNQLDLSQPLKTFIDNIVKMGSLYAGNDAMFAAEYRKHLVPNYQQVPLKANINFMRDIQERNIAQDLKSKLDYPDLDTEMGMGIGGGGGSSSSLRFGMGMGFDRNRPDSLAVHAPVSHEFVKTRAQLEEELSELEAIFKRCHEGVKPPFATATTTTTDKFKQATVDEKKKTAMHIIRGNNHSTTARGGGQPINANTPLWSISGSGAFSSKPVALIKSRAGSKSNSSVVDETSVFYPRRSTRQHLRSDMTASLRVKSTNKLDGNSMRGQPLPPRRNLTLPRHQSIPRNLHLVSLENNNENENRLQFANNNNLHNLPFETRRPVDDSDYTRAYTKRNFVQEIPAYSTGNIHKASATVAATLDDDDDYEDDPIYRYSFTEQQQQQKQHHQNYQERPNSSLNLRQWDNNGFSLGSPSAPASRTYAPPSPIYEPTKFSSTDFGVGPSHNSTINTTTGSTVEQQLKQLLLSDPLPEPASTQRSRPNTQWRESEPLASTSRHNVRRELPTGISASPTAAAAYSFEPKSSGYLRRDSPDRGHFGTTDTTYTAVYVPPRDRDSFPTSNGNRDSFDEDPRYLLETSLGMPQKIYIDERGGGGGGYDASPTYAVVRSESPQERARREERTRNIRRLVASQR